MKTKQTEPARSSDMRVRVLANPDPSDFVWVRDEGDLELDESKDPLGYQASLAAVLSSVIHANPIKNRKFTPENRLAVALEALVGTHVPRGPSKKSLYDRVLLRVADAVFLQTFGFRGRADLGTTIRSELKQTPEFSNLDSETLQNRIKTVRRRFEKERDYWLFRASILRHQESELQSRSIRDAIAALEALRGGPTAE